MQRREFIRLSALGTIVGVTAPVIAHAETGKEITPPGDIYFTKDAPGRWAGKAATHLPVIEVDKQDNRVNIKVTTPHEFKGFEHYIVKHVLLDKNYKFIAEHFFDPNKDTVPVSSFTLENYNGSLHALSLCNKHDLWLASAEI